MAGAEAGRWSAPATRGACPGRGTRHGRAVEAQAGRRGASRGGAVEGEGEVHPGAEARSALNEQGQRWRGVE